MTKFFLMLVLWSNGDTFALDTGLSFEQCQARLAQAISNDLFEVGQLSCEVDNE